jgi:putative PEP-CTERM system histidine kinase
VTLSLGFISYSLAAVGFLILTLLLAVSWEGRAQGVRLIAASGASALWAALLTYDSWSQSVSPELIVLAEFTRDASWLVVLTGLIAREREWAWLSRVTELLAIGAVILAAALALAGAAGYHSSLGFELLVGGGLLLSLVALVLIEQIYRNANPAGRYALKLIVIGVGVLFVYDLFLYSQAQLLKAIEPASWDARGLVNALVVPLVALAARRNPQWSLNVFVSRQVVFYTTSFMVVGAYLLLMAAGGYAIRLYGGTWGRVAQLVFFAGAGIVLAVLLSSASLRRRLRVFLSKHFYKNKYDYRVEWLRFVETLSRRDADADTLGNAVRSIAQIVGSPGGVLFLHAEAEENFVAVAAWPSQNWSTAEFPPMADSGELPRFLQQRQWVVDLREHSWSPDAYQNVTVPDSIRVQDRLRLIVPLTLKEELLGFVALEDPPPPFEITYEDRDLLKTVGRDVATHVAQHEADRLLAESRQFEAYHRLTAFVMHDLKNLAAQLSLLVSNAERHRHKPEFVDDAISTIAHSAARMQRLIEQLQGRESRSMVRRTNLADLAKEACARCAVREPVPLCGDLDRDAVVLADPERLAMMVEHLLRNAQDATEPGGAVRVDVKVERDVEVDVTGTSGLFPVLALDGAATVRLGGEAPASRIDVASLSVVDTGCGMTPEFIKERLFRPFDSTKGSKGMGIGAYQVREYVHSIGGRLRVTSSPGEGTTIIVKLPVQL